ncbi:hypothetical protein RYX36_015309, partial [Vicia faba]
LIFEIYEIVSKEEDLTEAPDGSYYYLEEYGRKVYDISSISNELKSYLDELAGKPLADNQIR